MIKLIFASTRDADMRYATQANITSSFFLIDTGKKKFAILDKRDFGILTKAQPSSNLKEIPLEPFANEAKKLKHITSGRNKLALAVCKKFGLVGKKIQVPIHFPLDMADFLRKNGVNLFPTFPLYPERALKTDEEIKFIRENLKKTFRAYDKVVQILKASKIQKNRIYYRGKILTSEFLKQEAEKVLIENDMSDLLGMILSSGKDSAIPHHLGSGSVIPHTPIVCDIFAKNRETGYFSDMTRTFCKGKTSPEIEKMYQAVLSAQNAAFSKIKHGAKVKDVCNAAENIIISSGFHVGEQGMIHGLGHGVGLDIHEAPSLKADSEDILKTGNVITIEPGLYYPLGNSVSKSAGCGVRLEDIILVTKKGYLNLTKYPKRLVIS